MVFSPVYSGHITGDWSGVPERKDSIRCSVQRPLSPPTLDGPPLLFVSPFRSLPFLSHVPSLPEQPGIRTRPWGAGGMVLIGWDVATWLHWRVGGEAGANTGRLLFPVSVSSRGRPAPAVVVVVQKEGELVRKEPENEMAQCSGCIWIEWHSNL